MEHQAQPLVHRLHRITDLAVGPACRSNSCNQGRKPCPTPAYCAPPWQESEEIREPFLAKFAEAFAAFLAFIFFSILIASISL